MAVVEQKRSVTADEPQLGWTAVLHEWVTTVDHKQIGIMYVLMSVVFLVIAGCEAVLMRLQLLCPRNDLLGPDFFNQLFTMHGTTMVFFMGMPILIGIGNYVVPLMIGARDMAFPRLNAFGFWATLFGGLLVYFSFATGGAPALGWFAYAPLTERTFARSPATDFWALGLIISGFGTVTAAINFVATILTMRGQAWMCKVPFYVWTMLWTSIQILIALPPLTAALVMVMFDRQLDAHFFDVHNGGSAYLWQHLFWFFGHPEVYILILPAFGMISEVIPVFSRKVLFGYEFMAAATMAIVFISFGVWAHHMFTVGMSRTLDLLFAASSLLVSVPTGIKFFNWLATMYGGRIVLASPMLFAFGFLSMFLIGGLTGIMLAVAPFDFQLSDSYFVVGHFHWVLIGGTIFGVFAGIHYWYPKVTGRMLSERLARWQFWLLYIGFMLTFGPMHIAGMLGMPRRIFTYEADRPWEIWNQLSTVGALIQVPSFAIFVFNVFYSLRRGKPAGADPWDAWTLEWATTSPPPSYNFATIPEVRSAPVVGFETSGRSGLELRMTAHQATTSNRRATELLIAPEQVLNTAQWGMVAFLLSEVAFFSTLIVAYVTFMGQDKIGPTPREALSLSLVTVTTICLLASSVTVHLATKHLPSTRAFISWWGLTIVLGTAFLVGTAYEWYELVNEHHLTISRNMFGTTYYTLVGFHALHVTIGVVALMIIWVLAMCRELSASQAMGVELVSWYWHFVDVVWIFVFSLVYLIGR